MMKILVFKYRNAYKAKVEGRPDLFQGYGDSHEAAVGDLIVSNRDKLSIEIVTAKTLNEFSGNTD